MDYLDIFVLDKGKIIQEGSHSKLVKDIKGQYYEMWKAQSKYYQ